MAKLTTAIEWARTVLWDDADDAPEHLKCGRAEGIPLLAVAVAGFALMAATGWFA